MTNELTKIEQKERQQQWLAERGLTTDMWSSLQNSVYPGAKPESIVMAVSYCKARNLDPLKKPVHIVPIYVKDARTGQGAMRDVIMPGIYEYRTTAARTGQYAGMDEPKYGPIMEYKGVNAPEFCTITVHRIVAGTKVSFSHTEFFEEAIALTKEGKPNAMWQKRPKGQLAKCAEAGALRKAFPEDLGGTITAEEADEYEASVFDKKISTENKSIIALEAEILGEPIHEQANDDGLIINEQTGEVING